MPEEEKKQAGYLENLYNYINRLSTLLSSVSGGIAGEQG
jgi:hypothetical protein